MRTGRGGAAGAARGVRLAAAMAACVGLSGACTPPPATLESARDRIADILECDPRAVAFDYVEGTKYTSGYFARGCGRSGLFRCHPSTKVKDLFVCEVVQRSGDWTAGPPPPIQLAPPPPVLHPGDT